ncbi:hypothetical protein [Sporosarcina sp. 6E9]|uniref:hypothetical protein n=1 Tax=Sporosarcina sp. 6E9 TaxID=2819235 RepID=UPI001AD36F7B|nr:hypothetical protein [Sporosarcina sp. 6E9]MBO1912330.1 hypothetical protein [Microvirga sp. 3-52]
MDFENFKEYLLKEYKMGETSANQYVGRLKGIINRGLYNGECTLTPSLLAALKREYSENSMKNYKPTIERYIKYLEKTGEIQ